MNFNPSRSLSVGAELELQILDAETLDLADAIFPLMERIGKREFIKPEVLQNTVEVTSKICSRASELEWHLREQVREVIERGETMGLRFCGSGTHPFSPSLAAITPKDRYLRMENEEGYVIKAQVAFATHVHLGVASPESMMSTFRGLRAYIPILTAVAANSPFFKGHRTGHACYRQRILASSQSYGIPPNFADLAEFERLYGALVKARAHESIRDLHWDIRPRPDFGTVEIRAMDAQQTVGEVALMASLARVLAAYLQRVPEGDRPEGLPRTSLHPWIERENQYQAARAGFDARYIRTNDGESVPLMEVYEELIGTIGPYFRFLGEWEYLEALQSLPSRGAGFARQLEAFERTGSMREVTRALAEALERDCGLVPGERVTAKSA